MHSARHVHSSGPSAIESATRIASLQRTQLLDTPPDASFDRITRLAAQTLEVPVAAVSLVDRDRQFFKSCHGLSEPWVTLRETPLSHSFCQHVVRTGAPFIVEDARDHDLVRDNLAVSELGVIAYAGIPLLAPEGEVIGSFCAIDSEPRTWTKREIQLLTDFAELAMTEIELRADISDLARAEQQTWATAQRLCAAEARMTGIIDSAMDAIITVDNEQVIQIFNRGAERIFGCPAEDALGRPLSRFLPLRYQDAHREHVKQFSASGVAERAVTGRNVAALRADGTEFPAEAHISQAEVGGERLYTVILRDVTERRRQEEAVHEARTFLDSIIENIPDLVYVKNARDFRYVRVNRATTEFMGFDLTGRVDEEVFGEDEARVMRESDERVVQTGEFVELPASTFSRPGGGERRISTRKMPLFTAEGEVAYILGISIDVTDEERTRELELQTRKLESLSILAGGVAHDFNNAMLTILGNAELAMGEIEQEGPVFEMVSDIVAAGTRAANLSRQMLAYSGKGRFVIRSVSLNELVASLRHEVELAAGPAHLWSSSWMKRRRRCRAMRISFARRCCSWW